MLVNCQTEIFLLFGISQSTHVLLVGTVVLISVHALLVLCVETSIVLTHDAVVQQSYEMARQKTKLLDY